MDAWEERLEAFWSSADDENVEATLEGIAALVAELPDGDPIAIFEMAGAFDSVGQESEAIPLYRAALAAGLDEPRQSYAVVQLASSLRNVGEPGEAVELLQNTSVSESIETARAAFLALSLFDAGRRGDALKTALTALAPSLTNYGRAITHYASELPEK